MVEAIPPGRAVSFEREVFPRLVGEACTAATPTATGSTSGRPSATSRRPTTCWPGALRASFRDATRPPPSSMTAASRAAPGSARCRCSGATARWAPTRRSSARCCTTACALGASASSCRGRARPRGCGSRTRRGPRSVGPVRSSAQAPWSGRGAWSTRARARETRLRPSGERHRHRARGLPPGLADVLAQPAPDRATPCGGIESARHPAPRAAGRAWRSAAGWRWRATWPRRRSGDRATAPVRDVRGSALEPWTRDDTRPVRELQRRQRGRSRASRTPARAGRRAPWRLHRRAAGRAPARRGCP